MICMTMLARTPQKFLLRQIRIWVWPMTSSQNSSEISTSVDFRSAPRQNTSQNSSEISTSVDSLIAPFQFFSQNSSEISTSVDQTTVRKSVISQNSSEISTSVDRDNSSHNSERARTPQKFLLRQIWIRRWRNVRSQNSSEISTSVDAKSRIYSRIKLELLRNFYFGRSVDHQLADKGARTPQKFLLRQIISAH